MREPEHMQHLRRQLETHKKSLHHLEQLAAMYGGESRVPVELFHQINGVREQIRNLEDQLRNIDPSDGGTPSTPDKDFPAAKKTNSPETRENRTRPRLWAAILLLVACIGCAGILLGGTLLRGLVNTAGSTTEVPTDLTEFLPTDFPQPMSTKPGSSTPEPSATMTIQPTSSPSVSETLPPTPNTMFVDAFDDLSKGWVLDNSTVHLGDKLSVTVARGNRKWIELPGVNLKGNFYIQADMAIQRNRAHACFSAMGFALGANSLQQNSFLYVGGCSGDQIGFYENNAELSTTPITGVNLEPGTWYTIGLRAKAGQFTIYINGKPMVTAPATVDYAGGETKIAIFLWRVDSAFLPADSIFLIDNVLLQSEP